MSDLIAVEPRRLDEIAAVTKEYSAYSRTAHGLAFVATGAMSLALIALDATAGAKSPYLVLTPVCLLLLSVARRYYQRLGVVLEVGPRSRLRPLELSLVWLLSAAVLWQWLTVLDANGVPPGSLETALYVFGGVGTPLLASLVAHGGIDISSTTMLMLASTNSAEPPAPGKEPIRLVWVIVLGGVGAIMIAQGIHEHLRYRRLERRLRALKATA